MIDAHTVLLICIVVLTLLIIFTCSRDIETSTAHLSVPLSKADLSSRDVKIVGGRWVFKGQDTHVCFGKEGEVYEVGSCYAGGGTTLPSIAGQCALVREAIDNGGVHPLSPRPYY